MNEAFISKNFTGDSSRIITFAQQVCTRYAAQGFDLSLRQLYYQFVAANKLENTEQNYKRLGSIISDARLAGLIDWEMIKDRGRETISNPHWNDAAHFMESVAPQFRIDTWEGQPNYVEVMVEKQALEGVLEPVCRNLDIKFTANKGYSSSSALYETGKRLQAAFVGEGDIDDYDHQEGFNHFRAYVENAQRFYDYDLHNDDDEYEVGELEDLYERFRCTEKDSLRAEYESRVNAMMRRYMKPCPENGKALHVIYLGDHDPSGIDMTRDVRERLELFSRCPVKVHRVALNMDQVQQYNPPPNPAKMTDSRAEDYVRKFGRISWELDALEPSLLASLVQSIVVGLRDDEKYEETAARQSAWREELKALADKFRGESEAS